MTNKKTHLKLLKTDTSHHHLPVSFNTFIVRHNALRETFSNSFSTVFHNHHLLKRALLANDARMTLPAAPSALQRAGTRWRDGVGGGGQ